MASSPIDDLRIEEIKHQLASFVEEGRLDMSLVQLLTSGNQCAPVECELLDYKERLDDDRLAKAKAVLQIVCFYNTYGGYLIFGVAEREAETTFQLTGVAKGAIDIESLKALIQQYTGERVGLTLQYFSMGIRENILWKELCRAPRDRWLESRICRCLRNRLHRGSFHFSSERDSRSSE